MNQDQYLQYIQSNKFVDKYLSALEGKGAETTKQVSPYQLNNVGISQFAVDRGYDQLFTKQEPAVVKKSSFTGNNKSLINSLESENPVKDMLYSQKNINFLQQKCIEAIYYKTDKKYLISPQDPVQLLQIITNVYNHIPIPNYYPQVGTAEFKKTISYLNSFVLKEFIEYTYEGLKNYISYSEFLANGIQPIDRPVNVSIKGTNTLIQ